MQTWFKDEELSSTLNGYIYLFFQSLELLQAKIQNLNIGVFWKSLSQLQNML